MTQNNGSGGGRGFKTVRGPGLPPLDDGGDGIQAHGIDDDPETLQGHPGGGPDADTVIEALALAMNTEDDDGDTIKDGDLDFDPDGAVEELPDYYEDTDDEEGGMSAGRLILLLVIIFVNVILLGVIYFLGFTETGKQLIVDLRANAPSIEIEADSSASPVERPAAKKAEPEAPAKRETVRRTPEPPPAGDKAEDTVLAPIDHPMLFCVWVVKDPGQPRNRQQVVQADGKDVLCCDDSQHNKNTAWIRERDCAPNHLWLRPEEATLKRGRLPASSMHLLEPYKHEPPE